MDPAVHEALALLECATLSSGTAPVQWVSAIATAVAAIVALSVAVRSEILRKQDMTLLAERQAEETAQRRADEQRWDEERRDREMAQARAVLLSVESSRLVVTNHSAEPVLDVVISEFQLVEKSGIRWTGVGQAQRGVPLGPGDRWVIPLPKEFSRHPEEVPPQTVTEQPRQPSTGDHVEATYVFADSRGRAWSRTGNEQPKRVTYRMLWGPRRTSVGLLIIGDTMP